MAELVDALRRRADPVHDPTDVARASRDPNDDHLVALAVAADADVLVSGDRDLTELEDPPTGVRTPLHGSG